MLACVSEKEEDLSLRWLNATEILNKNPHFLEGVVITRPEGTWQSLFILEKNDKKQDCVFFKIPSQTEKGILKIKGLPVNEKCENLLLDKGDVSIQNISEFSYKKNSKALTFLINNKEYKFHFLNSALQDQPYALFEGDYSDHKSEIRFLGKEITQREILKQGEFCHRYKDDCSEEIAFQCDRCENGVFTQVINSSCQKGYAKICGDISCGELNAPACIRGFGASGLKEEYCVQDSPLGFCREGLRVRCVDGALICSQ